TQTYTLSLHDALPISHLLRMDARATLRSPKRSSKKRAVRIEFFYFRLATVYLSTSKYSLRLLVESTDPQTRERAVKLAEDLRRLDRKSTRLNSSHRTI